jgi:purine-binding chemotaxis protein CheW
MTNENQLNTEIEDLDSADDSKYLIFRIGNESYGTPLLGVREVLESQTPKPIPNTAPHFKGLINVRGQIIGVVDLRVRFGYPASTSPSLALMVFETETGAFAAIVDKVEAVIKIDEKELNQNPHIRSQIAHQFLIGAASYDGGLVTLVDLNKILSTDEYVQIQKAKLSVME